MKIEHFQLFHLFFFIVIANVVQGSVEYIFGHIYSLPSGWESDDFFLSFRDESIAIHGRTLTIDCIKLKATIIRKGKGIVSSSQGEYLINDGDIVVVYRPSKTSTKKQMISRALQVAAHNSLNEGQLVVTKITRKRNYAQFFGPLIQLSPSRLVSDLEPHKLRLVWTRHPAYCFADIRGDRLKVYRHNCLVFIMRSFMDPPCPLETNVRLRLNGIKKELVGDIYKVREGDYIFFAFYDPLIKRHLDVETINQGLPSWINNHNYRQILRKFRRNMIEVAIAQIN